MWMPSRCRMPLSSLMVSLPCSVRQLLSKMPLYLVRNWCSPMNCEPAARRGARRTPSARAGGAPPLPSPDSPPRASEPLARARRGAAAHLLKREHARVVRVEEAH